MFLVRTSPAVGAEAFAVSLDDAREQCRVIGNQEDGLIEAYLFAALTYVGEATGRVLAAETWAASFDSVCGDLVLPKAPVKTVTAISYFDAAGVSQSALVADFLLIKDDDRATLRPISGKTWPPLQDRPDALTVTFTAGYSVIPAALKVAVLLIVGHLYEQRAAVADNMSEVPFGARSFIDQYRLNWIAA